VLGDEWPLASAETMRALDLHTIEDLGISGELLMECAGLLVAREVVAALQPGGSVWVVCGPGNNGGDGLVVARQLHLRGLPVRVSLVSDPQKLHGDALASWRRAERVGVPTAASRSRLEPGSVVVDALFGTGLARAVTGPAAVAIRRINQCRPRAQVVSIDLPSGLHADTGQPLGVAVQADVTLTLGLPKLGLVLEPGRSQAGRIVVGRIGIADEAPQVRAQALLWTARAAARRLPPRPRQGHKGTFGHVLVVAGSEGKTGAAALAAEGAARAGAGLVTIACPETANPVLEAKCTEAMTAPVPETAAHSLGLAAEKPICDLALTRDAVVLGPGMGRLEETFLLVRRVAHALGAPLVLDADALLAWQAEPTGLRGRRAPTLLTPHPGEAAALLGGSAAEVNADRAGAAAQLAEQTHAVVVLKGAATITASSDGQPLIVNPTGGPLLATGGTGDVLAGVIAGLLAQGLAAREAGALGAYLHGAAADGLAAEYGEAGILAGELAAALPATLRDLRARAAETSIEVRDALDFPEPG